MTAPLAFVVWGHCAPKGAVRPVPLKKDGQIVGSRLTEDSTRSRPWQALVRDAAQAALCRRGQPGVILFGQGVAVRVRAVIWLPAPKSLPRRSPSAPVGKRAGDTDKLARGLLDALTDCVVVDDGQVVDLRVLKCYAKPGTMPRVELQIHEVDLQTWPWNESQVNPALEGARA